MAVTVEVQLQLRQGTAASWTSSDPTLLVGELGYETDTGYYKWGDGSTAWTSLSYLAAFGGEVTATGFTGTLDGILGGGTPAAATVTALTSNGITDSSAATAMTIASDGKISVTEDFDLTISSNEFCRITAENTAAGTAALAQIRAVSNAGAIDMRANSTTYTGVSGWDDRGVINLTSGLVNGLLINIAAGDMVVQHNQVDALTLSTTAAAFGAALTAVGGVDSLTSATTTVSVAAATAPTVGQVLTATSDSLATWQRLLYLV